MPTPFIKLKFPPGLVRSGTPYSTAMGRYYDAALIRFFEGQIRPMKGWATGLAGTLDGVPRAAHAWKDNDQASFAALGTTTKLYAHDGATLDEITPTGFDPGDADADTVTFDNFGELLILCGTADKTLLEWQPGGGGDATAITNAPTADATFVTAERFVVALGADGDPRRAAWCDQENLTVWTASATNQAGDLNLQTEGVLMCGTRIRGAALIWTDRDVHLMRYIGLPDVYGIEPAGQACGIIGRHAYKAVDSLAYWMGQNAFYVYGGYVESIKCDIGDDVFTNLNQAHRHKVWCRHDAQFAEIWWMYPRGDATECSHYAVYNYREKHWNHGPLARTAGFDQGAFDWPLMATSEGAMLKHETGWDYDDADRFVTSGPIEMGNGERLLLVDEFLPDETNQGDCDTWFSAQEYPNATPRTLGPYSSTDRVSVLFSGRQVAVKYQAKDATEDFRIGNWRFAVKQRGRY